MGRARARPPAGAAGGGGKGGWCLAPGGRWVNAMGKGAKPSWWWPPQAPDRSWPAPPGHEAWEPSEAEGSAFYFRVNGQPVYAKGANLIPLSVLPTNVTGADLRRLLDDALDAHMNMVRIWGGGVYPSDDLYDYADERGIMIWQETAFACAPYPRDPAFLDNVRVEVEQQARRLGWHASVVIWGGNNEVEASMEWYEDTRSNAALYAVDYDRLFVDTIGGVLQKLAPSTPFVDSSPSNGMVSPRLGVKRWANAQDPRHGDVHYYNYAADCQDWRHYPRARFVSEYGWQSYPTWPTYRAATAAPDWSVASEMHEYRQRHPNGTREILAQLDRRFTLPPSWRTLLKGRPAAAGSGRGLAEAEAMEEAAAAGGGGGAARDARQEEYRSFIYLTQVQQMLCYDTAIGLWRRLRSDPDTLTMGVLYWQLNDIWAGASWSSVDADGRWKPLHYGAARLFAPLAASVVEDWDGGLEVYAISDHRDDLTLEVRVTVHSLASAARRPAPGAFKSGDEVRLLKEEAAGSGVDDSSGGGGACGAEDRRELRETAAARGGGGTVHVPGSSAGVVYAASVEELLAALPGCTRATCLVRAVLTPISPAPPAGGAPAPAPAEAFAFLGPFKGMPLRDPQIATSGFSRVRGRRDAVTFTVAARAAAPLAVWEAPGLAGRFSENAISLVACEPRQITFYAAGGAGVEPGQLQRELRVSSLWDHQRF